ncbi:AAA family ATPase [Micromonospora taraxaci]|uniref:AAA family ATPase n=1 Tax=Micromonospora taraxaci TaxID=1316803 RepID=UPI00339FCB3E
MPVAPPWRQFEGEIVEGDVADPAHDAETTTTGKARMAIKYRAGPDEARLVNAAIYLRRPLLVTGLPGTGKSTLAYSIAHELDLGGVLTWPVTSRSNLSEGLFQYDALGRLHDANLAATLGGNGSALDIGHYVTLGPLGTALLPRTRPRVLLIDEIDKADVDLPNDLLSVLEDGRFVIPPLRRLSAKTEQFTIGTDDGGSAKVYRGQVTCREFPIVIFTSNGERDFPPAFLRRCVRLDIAPPSKQKLRDIVTAQLGPLSADSEKIVDRFCTALKGSGDLLSVDQVLNAILIEESAGHHGDEGWASVINAVLRPLNK